MEKKELPKFIRSSADPTRVASTLKGALTLLVGIAGVFGIDIPGTLVDEVVEVGVAAVGVLWMLFGLIRKVVIFFGNKE